MHEQEGMQGAQVFPAQGLGCLKGEHASGEQRSGEDGQVFLLDEIGLDGTQTKSRANIRIGPGQGGKQQTAQQAENGADGHSMPPLTETTWPVM